MYRIVDQVSEITFEKYISARRYRIAWNYIILLTHGAYWWGGYMGYKLVEVQ